MENAGNKHYFSRLAVYIFVMALGAFFTTTCSTREKEKFSETEIEAAGRASDSVSEARLIERLKQITDARAAEAGRKLPSFSYATGSEIPYLGVSTFEFAKKVWSDLQFNVVVEEEQVLDLAVRNVYVDAEGSEPSADKVLVLAHYDSWGSGAVDNAAGVSVALELSNLLKGFKLKYGVRVLLTDFEEVGLLGVQSYLRKHSGENYRLVLNLDMLGYKSASETLPVPKFAAGFSDFPSTGEFLYLLSNDRSADWTMRISQLAKNISNLTPTLNVVVSKNGINELSRSLKITNADHSVFWSRTKSPTVFLTNGSSRFPHYHQATDTFDKVDSVFLLQNARLAAAIVAAAAGAGK